MIIILLVIALLVSGCGVPKVIYERDTTIVTNTQYIETIRDSLIEVPIPVEVYHNIVADSSHLETRLAVSDAWVDTVGLLHHNLENKQGTIPVIVPIKSTAYTMDKKESIQLIKKVPVEKELTLWQKIRIKSFWWLILLCIIGFRREILFLIKKIL